MHEAAGHERRHNPEEQTSAIREEARAPDVDVHGTVAVGGTQGTRQRIIGAALESCCVPGRAETDQVQCFANREINAKRVAMSYPDVESHTV